MKTILIVDDRHINREVLSILLDENNYQILEAENGIQALELAKNNNVDLIITDILMPEMDGLALVRELQADVLLQKIPVIFYSATYKAIEAYRLANASNVKYVLTKPCHPQTILSTIEEALNAAEYTLYPKVNAIYEKKIENSKTDIDAVDEKKQKFEDINLRLTNLIEIGLDMSQEHDIEKLTYIACRGGRQFLDACYTGVILQTPDNPDQYKIFKINKSNEATSNLFESYHATGLLRELFLSNKPICIHSPIVDLEQIGLGEITLPIASLLAIPLRTVRASYGKIYFINKFNHKLFTLSDQRFMLTLADKFSVHYENLLLYHKIQQHTKQLESEIQQRKETELFLHEITERLHLTLEAAHVGTWCWSIPTGKLEWDKYAALLFGIDLENFGGTQEAFLKLLAVEDRNRVEQEFFLISKGNQNQGIEFKIVWPDKSIHHLMLRGKMYYNETGEPVRMIGVYWDITEHMQAEEKLNLYREQMSEVVRSNSLGEMASSLAHEVNQPLAAIAAYIKGCIKRLESKPKLTPEIIEILHETAKQAERAGKVLNRIKNFVKKGELFYETVDINALIKETFHLMQQEIQRFSIKVTYQLYLNMPFANVDKVQLQQVILNLIRNAIEAIQEANTINPEIIVESRLEITNRITIRISDNGPGFNDTVANHLFELYFTTKRQGMGLGLAICRSIIEAHAGQLSALRLPNGGSCFQFDFPVKGLHEAISLAPLHHAISAAC